ncbi:hypothetical protein ACH5RR_015313 [Cinchona calisaya]|uniref:Uncharacterized protein n=1 Tax=Cinchona calisaya TaxID=153742 RepID=A0ABD2ZSU9_9GENT
MIRLTNNLGSSYFEQELFTAARALVDHHRSQGVHVGSFLSGLKSKPMVRAPTSISAASPLRTSASASSTTLTTSPMGISSFIYHNHNCRCRTHCHGEMEFTPADERISTGSRDLSWVAQIVLNLVFVGKVKNHAHSMRIFEKEKEIGYKKKAMDIQLQHSLAKALKEKDLEYRKAFSIKYHKIEKKIKEMGSRLYFSKKIWVTLEKDIDLHIEKLEDLQRQIKPARWSPTLHWPRLRLI